MGDFENCKTPCLFSWCGKACIDCNHGSDVIGCIGFVDPQPSVCGGASLELIQRVSSNAIVKQLTAVVLIGLFMASGIIFSLLRFTDILAARKEPQEPLMDAWADL